MLSTIMSEHEARELQIPDAVRVNLALGVKLQMKGIVYEGVSYDAYVLDFETISREPLWANTHEPVLTKAFKGNMQLLDMHDTPRYAVRPMPEMPRSTYNALAAIVNLYCGAPIAVRGFELYLCLRPPLGPGCYERISRSIQGAHDLILEHCIPVAELCGSGARS